MKIWWAAVMVTWLTSEIRAESAAFDYREVVLRAEALAKEDFRPETQELSPDLLHLDYDQYRRIRFLPEHSLWHDTPFHVSFFHPGYNFRQRVLFHAIKGDRLEDIPFSPSYFYYDQPLHFSGQETFVGFKAFVPSSQPGDQDEFLSFLGASYFRAIARKLHWGLSTRGLAVNNGTSTPEEFPVFREFWFREPAAGDRDFQFYALLDSPSVTGGYAFDVRYGDVTFINVQSTIFVRRRPEVLELAPLTSMFYFGQNTVNKPVTKPDYQTGSKEMSPNNQTGSTKHEFRPQVHDSDGLWMETSSGEKLWAPLDNPSSVTVRRFSDVKSFGLLQRDRDFSDYLDEEAEYHRRPNLLVVPKSGLGPGFVRLLEIPTKNEYADNIVAGWEVANPPEKGGRLEFTYELQCRSDEPDTSQLRVTSTRLNPDQSNGTTRFTVEFASPATNEVALTEDLRPHVLVSSPGQIKDVQLTRDDRGWIVNFTVFKPNLSPALDVSCVLLNRDKFISEKWLYLLNM